MSCKICYKYCQKKGVKAVSNYPENLFWQPKDFRSYFTIFVQWSVPTQNQHLKQYQGKQLSKILFIMDCLQTGVLPTPSVFIQAVIVNNLFTESVWYSFQSTSFQLNVSQDQMNADQCKCKPSPFDNHKFLALYLRQMCFAYEGKCWPEWGWVEKV